MLIKSLNSFLEIIFSLIFIENMRFFLGRVGGGSGRSRVEIGLNGIWNLLIFKDRLLFYIDLERFKT